MTPDFIPTLLICEDPAVSQAISNLLANIPKSNLLPEVRLKAAAPAELTAGVPDVQAVLLHLSPDIGSALAWLGRLRQRSPKVAILAFTLDSAGKLGSGALPDGVDDILRLRPGDGEWLIRALSSAVEIRRAHCVRSEAEDRLQYFLTAAPIGYYQVSDEDRIMKANSTLAFMLGYSSADQLVGMKLEQVGSSLEYSRSVFWQLIQKEGQISGLESMWVKEDGTTLQVRESARAVRDLSGQILYYEGVVSDITHQVYLEEALHSMEARWGGILDTAMDAVITVNRAQQIVYANAAAEHMFGYSLNELSGQDLDQLIPERFQEAHRGHIEGFDHSEVERRRMGKPNIVWGRRSDGEEFPIEASIYKVDVSGHTYYASIIRDVTEQMKAQEEMKLAAEVFNSTSEGIIITNDRAEVISVNKAFTAITGYTPEEVLGKNPRFLKSGRHGEKFYKAMWKTLLQAGTWRGEIWNRRKNGDIYPEWLTITAVRDQSGEIVNFIAIFIDISARMQNEQLLRFLATHDPLTNLPNRELFRNRLRRALARAQRSKKRVAVLLIDLDGFKNVNDNHGHLNGDQLLQDFANRLMGCMRESDTVARLGGDEFTIILEGVLGQRDVDVVIEKLRKTLTRPYQLNGHKIELSSSMGISVFPDDAQDAEGLIQQADSAMYLAKELGKNRHHYFSDVEVAGRKATSSLEAKAGRPGRA